MDKGYIRPNKTPDLDNYTKLALDALNDILWEDDRYIIEIHATKYYSTTQPRLDITLDTIPEIKLKTDLNDALKYYEKRVQLSEFFDVE